MVYGVVAAYPRAPADATFQEAIMKTKRPYVQPRLQIIGAVADLTQTGNSQGGMTRPFTSNGFDAKGGSVTSNGR